MTGDNRVTSDRMIGSQVTMVPNILGGIPAMILSTSKFVSGQTHWLMVEHWREVGLNGCKSCVDCT